MAVISVRIPPDELKAKMKELDINWSEEIRKFIEERVHRAEKQKKLDEIHRLLSGGTPPADEGTARKYVRDDRDSN
ncbi:hypothetical protein [Thermococcus sp. JCM 11816]|uniref:type II toxin-antitoxin system VapB family antitoxin n=1 Tax=Thermococcus sp. (strain JCM 11816 / KS-1) TaxID=1295125 RepID=UPI0006D2C35D